MNFCVNVLDIQRPPDIGTAIIFGMATRDSLLPEAACAFLRHAYNQFYHDFANVDIKDAAFHWPLTFRDALHSFRNAVLLYAMKIKVLFNTRYYSTLEGIVPREARERFPSLVDIDIEGNFVLTTPFQQAIDDATTDAETHINSLHAPTAMNQPALAVAALSPRKAHPGGAFGRYPGVGEGRPPPRTRGGGSNTADRSQVGPRPFMT